MTILALLTLALLGDPTLPAAVPNAAAPSPSPSRSRSTSTVVVDLAAASELRRLQDRYLKLDTLHLDFREKYTNQATKTVVEETGVLTTARPGQMRWEYQHPEKKLFIQNGSVAWFHVPEEEVAYRMDTAGDNARGLPTLFLAGGGDLTRDYHATLVKTTDPTQLRIKLVPHAEGEAYDHLLVDIDAESAAARRMTVVDALGNETEFQFSNERRNIGVLDGQFQFEPPAGIDIVHSNRR